MRYLLIIFILACACQPKESTDSDVQSQHTHSRYLTDKVSPLIDADADIAFRFRREFEVDQSVEVPISFQPHIEGEAEWTDSHTLVFRPSTPLKFGAKYMARLKTKSFLKSVAEDIDVNFVVRPLELTIDDLQKRISLEDTKSVVHISGVLRANQHISDQEAEEMITVSGLGDGSLTWSHSPDGRTHTFELPQIEQPERDEHRLKVTWSGRRLNRDFKGAKELVIQPIGEFALTDVHVIQKPDRKVRIIFNQPLAEGQDLSGLVRIGGHHQLKQVDIRDNFIDVYLPPKVTNDFDITVKSGIKAFTLSTLDSDYTERLTIEQIKPQIRLAEQGVIVPDMGGVTYPFEVVNLDTVDVEIFKIYDQNVLQFLQSNTLDGQYNLEQVGKVVHREQLPLADIKLNQWHNIAIDLREMIQSDEESIYQVRLGFRPSYGRYDCEEMPTGYHIPRADESIMHQRWYGWEGREDPCSLAYYHTERFVSRNVLMSNVAPIIKRGLDHRYSITATDLGDASVLKNVEVTFYDYQKLPIGTANTGGKGIVSAQLEEAAAFAILKHAKGVMYVDLRDASANSITDFSTNGKRVKGGLDAFIYADRGVHRPGDTIHLYAILQHQSNLPADHPVTLTVRDAQGRQKYASTTANHLDQMYAFEVPTDQADPTGAWSATLQVGSQNFSKRLRVETIKPNRLRLELEHDDIVSLTDAVSRTVQLKSSWLHGAPASGLKVQIDGKWRSISPTFSNYKNYNFSDPARRIKDANVTIFKGKLNERGESTFSIQLDKESKYPAMLQSNLTNRVFEKGGDYSETYSAIKVSPYDAYVGVRMPESRWGGSSIKIGDTGSARVVSVDENGKPKPNRKLTIGIYDINWRWWYYRSSHSAIYELNSDQHTKAFYKGTARTDGQGQVKFDINTDDMEWGRKLIRVCDVESGHCTGQFFYASGWRSTMSEEERGSLSKLTFSADKEKYNTGDNVTLSIPSESGAKILISIESDRDVIYEEWIEASGEMTEYTFATTDIMAPNVYAHVSLVQPYTHTDNDLPIRMYGVLPIMVDRLDSHLYPVLDGPAELKPQEQFTLTVSEGQGQAMTYSVMIVDEGLLDLTSYPTPKPHSFFYAKRSLGVKTWDIYDDVLYGLNGQMDQILSVGGDGAEAGGQGEKKAIRFKPVVFVSGPHHISAGGRESHTFTMPNYIGSVRAMVVARQEESYGHVDKTMPVKTPLMVLPTVPRVLSQGEQIDIPVSVFAMKDGIKDVHLTLTTNDLLLPSANDQRITFSQQGEQVGRLSAHVGQSVGIAKIDVAAKSGQYRSSQQIEVDVRNPNPRQTKLSTETITKAGTWSPILQPFGTKGTNEAVLELSTLPTLKMADRIDQLIRYPYGCAEQTTSAAFPQLYLREVTDYVPQSKVDRHVKQAIKRLNKMQAANGGFHYWPSSRSRIHDWTTSYAGHFLVEAKRKGYFVQGGTLYNWSRYQTSVANNFTPDRRSEWSLRRSLLEQSYRLYTLALYGEPNLSAMNVHRERKELSHTASYMLAAAYAKVGKPNVAMELIQGLSTEVEDYQADPTTFGSSVRDMALIAQSLKDIGNDTKAFKVLQRMVHKMNQEKWLSTQSMAFGILTLGQLTEGIEDTGIRAKIKRPDGQDLSVDFSRPIYSVEVPINDGKLETWTIINELDRPLFASLSMSGQPPAESMLSEPAIKENISLSVKYTELDGTPLDVSQLRQGTDFLAVITINNLNTTGTYHTDLALTQIIPSGWEVRSGRLNEVDYEEDVYQYRDVRDDRVYTFFDLGKRKKFVTLLSATYAGEFYLPPVKVEAMYHHDVRARTTGQKITVVPAN